jgi:hypothetical protein
LVLANYEGMSVYRASLKEDPPSSFS